LNTALAVHVTTPARTSNNAGSCRAPFEDCTRLCDIACEMVDQLSGFGDDRRVVAFYDEAGFEIVFKIRRLQYRG